MSPYRSLQRITLNNSLRWLGILAFSLAANLAQAETGTLIRTTELKQKPFLDATSNGQLPANSSINIVGRQGAWMQVKVGTRTGWVKLLNVRTGSGTAASGNAISTLAKVVTTGSSGTTVTTGVKGVSKENLEKSEPNFKELEKLDALAISAQDAKRAAQQVKLVVVQVPEIILPTSGNNSTGVPANPIDSSNNRRRP